MQILMHSAICRTEYSCGHWAGCPDSGPPKAAFLLPSLFWHADKEQQGKEQGGESKVSVWQKFTANFMTLGKSFVLATTTVLLMSNLKENATLKPTSSWLDSSGMCPRLWKGFSCSSSLCTNCEYLTLWCSRNVLRRIGDRPSFPL